MADLVKVDVANGLFWVEAPKANLYISRGAGRQREAPDEARADRAARGARVRFETGPMPSSFPMCWCKRQLPTWQSSRCSMLYRQGCCPNHPNNTGAGHFDGSREQVRSQLEYIYRGNYGLNPEEELTACGIRRRRGA